MTEPSTGGRASTPHEARRYATGIALLLVVVLLWTLSNFITQALFSNGYHKPFLVTYFNTSAFAFYLIPLALKRCTVIPYRLNYKGYQPLPGSNAQAEASENIAQGSGIPPRDRSLNPLSTKETARLALTFCFLWFIANWTVNASLDYVSVASATILSSTSGFVTLGLGRLFGVESLTRTKVITVVTSFIGVVLVCLADNARNDSSSPSRQPILGDFLAALSAIFYALYVLLLKIRIKEESRINMQLFFGFVGMFNIVLMIPIAGLLHLLGYERFSLPHTVKEWGAVILNMFITWSSDYIYVLAMLKTTPVVVTIGLSLTIPLAVIGDTLLNVSISGQAFAGACLVLLSFVILGLDSANSRLPNDNALHP